MVPQTSHKAGFYPTAQVFATQIGSQTCVSFDRVVTIINSKEVLISGEKGGISEVLQCGWYKVKISKTSLELCPSLHLGLQAKEIF